MGSGARSDSTGCHCEPRAAIHAFFRMYVKGKKNKMKKIRRLCAGGLAAASVMLAGCGGGGDENSETLLNFSVIDSTAISGISTPRFTVTKNAADWATLWMEHKGGSLAQVSVPVIDFSQSMAIGVFLGQRPSGCYSVSIKGVVQSAAKITVQYKESKPEPFDICIAIVVKPSQIATIPLSNLPVAFVEVN